MFLKTRRHEFETKRVDVGGNLIIPPSDSLEEFVPLFIAILVFY